MHTVDNHCGQVFDYCPRQPYRRRTPVPAARGAGNASCSTRAAHPTHHARPNAGNRPVTRGTAWPGNRPAAWSASPSVATAASAAAAPAVVTPAVPTTAAPGAGAAAGASRRRAGRGAVLAGTVGVRVQHERSDDDRDDDQQSQQPAAATLCWLGRLGCHDPPSPQLPGLSSMAPADRRTTDHFRPRAPPRSDRRRRSAPHWRPWPSPEQPLAARAPTTPRTRPRSAPRPTTR